MKIRVIALTLVLILFCSLITVSAAPNKAAVSNPLDIKAKSAILVERTTGKVLYEKAPDEKLPPASVTKVMTLLLAMEALDSKTIGYKDIVTVSENAESMGGSQVYLDVGEKITVDEILKSIAISSGNDASVALAEFIAGSETAFVDKMNDRAKQLKMKNTVFKNCTGLDEDGHYTTARDIALMSCELLKHRDIIKYATIWMDSIRGGSFGLSNTNKLLKTYNGINGLKTGSTSKSLYCISASANRDNTELVAVVLAGETSDLRFKGAAQLLDYGFANCMTVKPKVQNIPNVKVQRGEAKSAPLMLKENNSTIVLKKGQDKKLQQSFEINDKIKAPVKKGTVGGYVIFKVDGEVVGKLPLVVKDDIKALSYFFILRQALNQLFLMR